MIIPTTTTRNIEAVQTFSAEYDLQWSLPSLDYKQFHLIGTKNTVPVAGYETRVGQTVFGIQIGDSRKTVRANYGAPLTSITKKEQKFRQTYHDQYNDETSGTYLIDDHYVTFFYDVHQNNFVRSILWLDTVTEMSKASHFAEPSPLLRTSFEDLMFALMNEARAKAGLQPFIYTPEYNKIARSHSTSMAENNYFGHVNLQGLRGGARMKIGGMTFNWWGENLAYGQYSAIHAHEALMNSISHRDNILREQFTHTFVGVDFNDRHQPYFTINFYSL